MKVFAIIVTYNGKRWLDRCLGSLAKSDFPVNIVVIDNASTDGTPERIVVDYPDVHLIRSNVNYGFAKANNIGIRYALDNGADYVFLLNQDAWVEKDCIEKLYASFSSECEVGVASPMHLNGAGDGLDWKFATNMPGEFVSDTYLCKLKNNYCVPYVNAAAWMISKECLNVVGGFDTNLFVHYGEDVNYSQRLLYWKLKLVVNTGAIIFHDREYRKGFESEYKQKVFKRDEDLHNAKLTFGNINYNIDIDSEIKRQKRYRIIKLLEFRFTDVKKKSDLIDLLIAIKFSREENRSGRCPWLNGY